MNYSFQDLRSICNFDVAIYSGIGKRDSQQDMGYVEADDTRVLAIVCDGMGGVSGGQIASKTAMEVFIDYYHSYMNDSNCSWRKDAVAYADETVYMMKDAVGNKIGSGTTLASVVLNEKDLYWISVGDSRIYIFRQGEYVQITNDHNYFYELDQQLSDGLINEERYKREAKDGEALISYIGMGGLRLFDINDESFYLQKGDVILLCTDGVCHTINDIDLSKIINESQSVKEMDFKLQTMIEQKSIANQDNYTYILIQKV